MSMQETCVYGLLTWRVNLVRLIVVEQSTPTAPRSVTQGYVNSPLLVICLHLLQNLWLYFFKFLLDVSGDG